MASSTLSFSISRPNHSLILSSTRTTTLNSPKILQLHHKIHNNSISCIFSVTKQVSKKCQLRSIKVSATTDEEETLAPVEESSTATAEESSTATAEESSDQTVSVPVSPSDVLTMFFQADGTLSDAAVPTVTQALEEVEGVSDLKVQVLEGIASVELTKQTTVQATGVASNLVEIMQGSGFKLQTLNLSFQDEEDFS